jgi:hypothetical protein
MMKGIEEMGSKGVHGCAFFFFFFLVFVEGVFEVVLVLVSIRQREKDSKKRWGRGVLTGERNGWVQRTGINGSEQSVHEKKKKKKIIAKVRRYVRNRT